MSAQTMAYPRAQSRRRADAYPAAKAPRRPDRAGRTSARSEARAARSAKRGASATPSGQERAARKLRWTRADALDFASRHRLPLAVALAVIVSVAALYGPTCDLYRAWRIETTREAQLSQINDSNASYQSDIDRLQTREGIEDEARKRGYVEDGETSVVVEGLEDTSAQDDATTADDTPWYLRVGDVIFRYEAE